MTTGRDVPSGVAAREVVPAAPVRVLLVASARLGFVAPLLVWVREQVRPVDVLVVREPAVLGAETYAAAIVARGGGAVERTADPVAELARCDGWLVGVADLDEVPTAVVHAATAAGLPGHVHVQGLYPMPPDEGSVASQRRARAWQAERDRKTSEGVRDAALASARSVRPEGRGGRSLAQARQAAWDARDAG